MKKLFLTLACFLVAACCALAVTVEEIAGTWQSKSYSVPFDDNIKTSCQDKYAFTKEGKATCSTEMSMTLMLDDHIYADVYFVGSYSGTFTAEGDSITINVTPGSPRFTMDVDKINVRGVDDPGMAETLRTQLAAQFGMLCRQMEASLPAETKLSDVKIDGKKMTCTDQDISLTFTRKKK